MVQNYFLSPFWFLHWPTDLLEMSYLVSKNWGILHIPLVLGFLTIIGVWSISPYHSISVVSGFLKLCYQMHKLLGSLYPFDGLTHFIIQWPSLSHVIIFCSEITLFEVGQFWGVNAGLQRKGVQIWAREISRVFCCSWCFKIFFYDSISYPLLAQYLQPFFILVVALGFIVSIFMV